MIELKPSKKLEAEYSSLFINCPDTDNHGRTIENIIKISGQTLEVFSDDQKDGDLPCNRLISNFCDISFDPQSLCSLSWVDKNQKILMCKVKAEAYGTSFVQKSFKKLEEELNSTHSLREQVQKAEGSDKFCLRCRHCETILHTHLKREFELAILPSDDWMETSPSLEWTCSMSNSGCCASHYEGSDSHQGGILSLSNFLTNDPSKQWLPNLKKIVLTDSFILFHKNESLVKRLKIIQRKNDVIILCKECSSELGIEFKGCKDVVKLNLLSVEILGDNQNCITSRFQLEEQYYAWLLLYKCEQHASRKLLVRSLEKKPHLLVWMIDPYVLLTFGTLLNISKQDGNCSDANPSFSFPALKVLYKIYDEEGSQSDPRASGQDSSVGIIDLPSSSSMRLTELLLTSSLFLPPPTRALGQFYVGFIRLKDRID